MSARGKYIEAGICDACGEVVRGYFAGAWNNKHFSCAKGGEESGTNCPEHNVMTTWSVGPWSTYRKCPVYGCTGIKGSRGSAKAAKVREALGGANEPSIVPDPTPAAPTPAPSAVDVDEIKRALLTAMAENLLGFEEKILTKLATFEKRIAECEAKTPRLISIQIPNQPAIVVSGAHKILPVVIQRFKGGFRNVYIYGPAGTGKTKLAQHIAEAMGLAHGMISCTSGMSESKIEGRMVPNLTTGLEHLRHTRFIEIYRDGGIFLFDEIDSADPNVLLVLNAALSNEGMQLPDGTFLARHPNAYVLAAGNTNGMGADRAYVGRNQLDAAFLDRFQGARLPMDYDRDIERGICANGEALERVWSIRTAAFEAKLKRPVGMRFVEGVAKLLGIGFTVDQAIAESVSDWTDTERRTVGVY